MREVILVCSCFNMSKKASEAFSLIHPDRELPPIIKGKDRIHKFAKELTPPNAHIVALSKLTGKFAYYIQLDQNNVVTEEYDLLRGVRIA